MALFDASVPEVNLAEGVAARGSDVVGVCGRVEQIGDGSPALKLQTNRPKVLVQDALPGHSQDEIWSWLREAHARWGAVCDWKAERINDLTEMGANDYVQLVTVADLGGSGVLADQMLPYTGGRILRMRINNRVQWRATDGSMSGGFVDPIRTLTHEIGHFMGHSHWPVGAPPELMEPTISQGIIGPQPTEARVSAGWFGQPAPVVPAPPSDAEGWLRRMTNDLLGRAPTPTEITQWLPLVGDPMRLAAALVTSAERYGVLTDSWYEKYLRRKADPGGRMNFVNALRAGAGHDHCVAVFLSSAEYRGAAAQSVGLDPGRPKQPPNNGGFVDQLFTQIANQLIDTAQKAGTDFAARTSMPFDDWMVAGVNRYIDAHQQEYVAAIAAKLKDLLGGFFAGRVPLEQLKAELKV